MEQIGFIGLGIMGKPMALNLLKAGYQVHILGTSGAADELEAAGAQVRLDKIALAEKSDIVITMLPDSPEVEDVVNDGLLNAMKPGTLFIDMSTITPSVAIHLHKIFAEKGIESLDAPVSGGQVGAEEASLSIMVGGSAAAFERALPVFQVMGKNIVHIGDAGAGQMTKACNQMIVGMTIQAISEAFALAEKANVDLEKMRQVLLGGFAQSRILDLHGQRIIDGNFKPGFKIRLHRKDMGIALATGEDLGVKMAGTEQVASLLDQSIKLGNAELDHSAMFLTIKS